jgi:transcription elongation factor GreA
MVQYFTKDGLQKLKDELHQLKTVENKRIVKLIAEAAAFGDLKENAAYHDARDKMSFLRMRIAELEGAINEAVVRDKDEDNNKIQIGSEIKILFGGVEEKYQVVAPAEANILKNKISYQSPLGEKLMGQKPGAEFNFQSGNKSVKIKILEIN